MPDSLLQTLLALGRELPGLLSDRVELLTLELKSAGMALLQIMLVLIAISILGVSAWLVLWGGIVVALVALGLHLAWALLILLVVNGVAIAVLMARLRALLPRLQLPATRRHLMASPATEPRPTEPELRHDRPDLASAGQAAAR